MRPVHLLALTIVVASSSIAPRTWGQRSLVRVSHDGACCQSPLTGTLLAESADSLWIRPEGARSSTPPVVLARHSVRELERGERVGRHMMVGALGGLLAGAVVGGVIANGNRCTHCDGMGNGGGALGAIGGALLGILPGMAIGALNPHYEWQRDDVPQRVSLTVGAGGATQLGAALRF
jgi:hypothetical protein